MEKATLNDLDALVKLDQNLFNTEAFQPSFIEECICNNITFVYRIENKIVGSIMCRQGYFYEFTILTLGVLPKYQRHGIGSLLLSELINHIKIMVGDSAFEISLQVRESNETAQRLYKRFGFELDGRIKNYYPDGEDGLEMSLLVERTSSTLENENKADDSWALTRLFTNIVNSLWTYITYVRY
jgi:[ribosomal protein S18]-alanine N-acetyltransferase